MFRFFAVAIAWLFPLLLSAQVINRSPYVQRPSQTSATIAWRRAIPSVSQLRIGTQPGVWTDTLHMLSNTQKHSYDLTGLQPATNYFYQALSVAPGDTFLSPVENFYTAAPVTEDDITFLVYGDCGYNNTPQHEVKALMQNETVDFAVVTGDVDQGNGDDYDNVFFGVYKDMLKRDCHFTCIGNHDTYADNAQTYLDEFYLFSNNPANTERYYSYTWGDAKFICLDANLPYGVGTAQYNWMIDELRCNDSKWLFVYCHQPPWTNAWSIDYYIPFTTYYQYQGDVLMRTALVPRWEEYGVDFVLNGHSHCYQRGEMNGIQYLISGGGGASTLDAHTNSNSPNLSVEIYENHYTKFLISGDTAKYYMINRNGVYRDSVMVVKPYAHYAATFITTPVSCYGMNDGSSVANVTGPKPPYALLWDNGQAGNNATGLQPGNHTVTVTDAAGCVRTETISITEPSLINTAIGTSAGVFTVCEGDSIDLYATPGYAAYQWSNGDNGATAYATAGGTYTVTITDAAGCTASGSQVVYQVMDPNSSFTVTDHQDLNIDFTGLPNTANSTYSWDFGDGFTFNSTGLSASHFYMSNGTYTVRLIVTNGCGSDTTFLAISISNSMGIADNFLEGTAAIWPNPFSGTALLHFPNPLNLEYTFLLSDVSGRVVRHVSGLTGAVLQIDGKDLSPGIYFYTLTGGEKILSGKVILE